MATSGPLTEIIGAATGMPARTVRSYADVLRDAGLLPIHGRGTSAADWDTGDAVNLLTAVVAADSRADAVKTVNRVRAAAIDVSQTITDDIREKLPLIEARDPALAAQLREQDHQRQLDAESVSGLRIASARAAGEALDGLLDDAREGGMPWLSCLAFGEFFDAGTVEIKVLRPDRWRSADYVFGNATGKRCALQRIARLNLTAVFNRLAEAIGPPEK
jgi:hypothetical protein